MKVVCDDLLEDFQGVDEELDKEGDKEEDEEADMELCRVAVNKSGL